MGIDDDATHVVLRLADGTEFRFDGPQAGRMANEFAKIYNNSLTFYQNINYLAEQQGGQYSFHSVPLTNGSDGSNRPGTDENNLFQRSVVVINSMTTAITSVLIHEVAHDLHDDLLPEDAPQEVCRCGASHSRAQTLFISNIVNELEHAGIDTGINSDVDDYSNNSFVFDSSIAQEEVITMTGASYEDIATAFETAGIDFSSIATSGYEQGTRNGEETLKLLLLLSDNYSEIANAIDLPFFSPVGSADEVSAIGQLMHIYDLPFDEAMALVMQHGGRVIDYLNTNS